MKNVEPVREFFIEHIKSVMNGLMPEDWFKDGELYGEITDLESEISLIRDRTQSDDEEDYERIQSEVEPLENNLHQLQAELAKKWQTVYPFIINTYTAPIHFDNKWDIGWLIHYNLETEEGEIAVSIKATPKLIEVEIGDIVLGFVGKNMKKVSDNFDIHNDFDKRRMFHHLSAK